VEDDDCWIRKLPGLKLIPKLWKRACSPVFEEEGMLNPLGKDGGWFRKELSAWKLHFARRLVKL
jgi:hypothetical protein